MDTRRLSLVFSFVDKASAGMKQLVAGSGKLKAALDVSRKAERDLQKQIGDVEAFRRQRVELRANERALAASKAAETKHHAALQQARQAHDALTAERKVARAELKRMERELIKAGQATDAQSLAQEKARNRLLAVEQRYAANSTEVRRHRALLVAAGKATTTLSAGNQRLTASVEAGRQRFAAAGVSVARLGDHQRRLARDAAVARGQIDRQAEAVRRLNRMNAAAGKLHGAGIGVAAHGAGAMYAGQRGLRAAAAPVAAAMTFESSMADVKKVVDFDTPEQFRQMSQDVQDLSMRLPMAAGEIATLVAAAGQANIPRQELLGFAEAAAKMGVAFDTTADEAGKAMATWRTAFRLNQDGVVELADKINYLGNTGPANVNQISGVVNRIGALGEVAGLSTGPLAALGATVAGMGIQEEVAATGIKNLLLRLNAGAAATKKQQQAFAELGLNSVKLAKSMQVDAKGTILDLLERIKKLPKDAQTSILQQIFGTESIGALAPLLNNTELLAENFNKVGDATKYAGSMENEYISRVGTSENALQLLKNTGNALAISIGQTLLPEFKQLAERTGEIVKSVVGWTRENPQLTAGLAKAAIAGAALVTLLGGLAVGVGSTMMFFGGLLKMLPAIGSGFNLVAGLARVFGTGIVAAIRMVSAAMLSNPITALLLLIGTLIYLVWKRWDVFGPMLAAVWQTVCDALAVAWEWIKTKAGELWAFIKRVFAFTPLGMVIANWGAIKAYLAASWQAIAGAASTLWAFIKRVFSFTPLGMVIANWDAIKAFLAASWQAIGGAASAVWAGIVATVQRMFDGLRMYLGGVWNVIAGLFSGNGERIRAGIEMIWTGISTMLGSWPARLRQAGVDMVLGLIDGLRSMLGKAGEAVAGVGGAVVDRFKSLLGIHSPSRVFAQLGGWTMEGLANGLQAAQRGPLGAMQMLGDRMRTAGSAVALGAAAALPVTASPLTAAPRNAAPVSIAGDTITIHVQGTDPEAIAKAVRIELERAQYAKAARARSALTDD